MIIVQNVRRGTVAWLHTGCEITVDEYQRADDYSSRDDALMWQMTGLATSLKSQFRRIEATFAATPER
jgi:hypothetical protein